MNFTKLINSKLFNIYLLIIFLGLYVHTYFIPLGRVGLKFFYVILLIHLIEFILKINRVKIKINLFDYFLILSFLYVVIQYFFTYSIERHMISMVYLINIILVARFIFSKYEKFFKYDNLIYILHIIIFAVGIFLFFYAIFFIGLGDIFLSMNENDERRDMANKLTTTVFYTGELPRYTGYYVDPNFWALHITFAIYFLSSIFIINKKRNYLFFIAMVILIISILLTQSRGALLALFLAYFTYMFLNLLFKNLSKFDIKFFLYLIGIFFLVVSILGSLDGVYGIDYEYMIGRYDSANLTNENSRTLGWKEYLDYISNSDYMYFGFGLSPNVYYFSEHSSHNIYIYLWYNFGLVWLIVFFIFILSTLILLIRKTIKVSRDHKKLYIVSTAFFIALLVQSFFIDVMFTIPFWANFILTYKILNLKGELTK